MTRMKNVLDTNYTDWKKGDKLICVDDKDYEGNLFNSKLYTFLGKRSTPFDVGYCLIELQEVDHNDVGYVYNRRFKRITKQPIISDTQKENIVSNSKQAFKQAFKVGDKVRIVKCSKPTYWYNDGIGTIVTIKSTHMHFGVPAYSIQEIDKAVVMCEDVELVECVNIPTNSVLANVKGFVNIYWDTMSSRAFVPKGSLHATRESAEKYGSNDNYPNALYVGAKEIV